MKIPKMNKKTILLTGLIFVQFVVILFPGSWALTSPSPAFAKGLNEDKPPYSVWLPVVAKPREKPLLIGLYEQADFGPTPGGEANVKNILQAADSWTGKKHSLIGLFADPELPSLQWGFTENMEVLWQHGYIPFVNIGSGRSAGYIASGKLDSQIQAMGRLYANWIAKGGGRKAFLAPLQEMNGYWVPYGGDPANYKLAYKRFRDQFAAAGAPVSSAWWVFAPNGYADPGYEFELYYPGDALVDVVGFSAYNFGFCAVGNPAWRKWNSPKDIYGEHISRMRAMAPGKPIIIAQTGTTDQYPDPNTHDRAIRDQWIIDAYDYLSKEQGVMAILYFDINLSNSDDCDYTMFNTANRSNGYKSIGKNPNIIYMSAAEISKSGFSFWK